MDPRSGVKNYVRLSVFLERHPDRSRRSFVVWKRRSRLHTSLPRMGKGDRVSGARVLSYAAQMHLSFPVQPSVFHAMSALSAPSGHLPRMGKGDRSAVDRVLSYAAQMRLSFPVLPSVFHAMSALSAPAGRLPPEGKTDDAGIASSHKTFGHRLIYICAAPPFRMSRARKALNCAKSGTLHGRSCFCFSFPTCVII